MGRTIKIARRVNSCIYLISNDNDKVLGKKHVNDIKLYIERRENNNVQTSILQNTTENLQRPRRSGRTTYVQGKGLNL